MEEGGSDFPGRGIFRAGHLDLVGFEAEVIAFGDDVGGTGEEEIQEGGRSLREEFGAGSFPGEAGFERFVLVVLGETAPEFGFEGAELLGGDEPRARAEEARVDLVWVNGQADEYVGLSAAERGFGDQRAAAFGGGHLGPGGEAF